MKNALYNTANNTVAVLIVTVLLTLFNSNLYAGNKRDVKQSHLENLNDKSIDNLIVGINSDNAGLKKSAIYLAGKYRLKETVESLVENLESEKDPSVKIIISLSLYAIDDTAGINAVKKLSLKDKNEKVRKMCSEIYAIYQTR